MVQMTQELDFDAFVAARSRALLKAAWLLTGDWPLAEDLLQTSLAKAFLAWRRIGAGREEAYVRRILVTTYTTWWRRSWRGELATGRVPEVADPRDSGAEADLRRVVVAALAELPRRQRAAVVLRFY